MALDITAARPWPALLDLPWSTPLEQWPQDILAALPRGISRHVVRFVRIEGRIIAVKEIRDDIARSEYDMLRALRRLDQPCVEAVGVVAGRTADDGTPLDGCLLTRHLQFSLPYRVMLGQSLREDTVDRLIDALAVLLVRLHLTGFWWGDVSLSNTLFKRNAGEFAAYLVDAETGELRTSLSKGQRDHDLDIARVNIAGELMDLQAGGMVSTDVDPVELSERILARYDDLWGALTDVEDFDMDQRWRVEERLRRLNDLGFDVGELDITTFAGGTRLRVQPKIVDAGHHRRRLKRLTGLDVEENQARRLLNDLDSFAASRGQSVDEDDEHIAHDWLADVWEPITRAVPREERDKLEPAELFHEILEHRWYMSEKAQHDVTIEVAARDYMASVLPTKPNEKAVVGVDPEENPVRAD